MEKEKNDKGIGKGILPGVTKTVFGKTNNIDPYGLAAQACITSPDALPPLLGYCKSSHFWTERINFA